MKKSMFVIEIPRDSGILLYNTLNGGLIQLDHTEMNQYIAVANGETSCNSPTISDLIKYKMLVDEDLDEYEFLLDCNWQARMQEEYLRFDIAPTTTCNFACTYCFEKGIKGETMSAKVCDDVSAFVLEKGENAKHIDIIWYGGEPLCAVPQIERISRTVLSAPGFFDKVSAKMITNGYALTDEVMQILLAAQVNLLQITIDGPRHAHDSKRMLRNGDGTFMRITENLRKYADRFDISVKINIDKRNKDSLGDLLDYWEVAGLKNKIAISLSRIISSDPDNSDILTVEEFACAETSFYRLAIDKGYDILFLPKASLGYCDATGKNHLICPDGSLFACLEDVGRASNIVGSIYSGYYDNDLHKYMMQTVDFGKDECRDCSVLPICLGGCPLMKFKHGISECTPVKYNIKECVEMWYDSHCHAVNNDKRNEKT